MVPGVLWYQDHAYLNRGILAHLKARGQQQPLPAFLSPAGTARMAFGAGTKASPFAPAGEGDWFPVYAHIGTAVRVAIVAEFGLVGSRGGYILYWEFRRE